MARILAIFLPRLYEVHMDWLLYIYLGKQQREKAKRTVVVVWCRNKKRNRQINRNTNQSQ
jgi:hypothetical protein